MDVISSKIVKARKEHTCGYCNQSIHPGELYHRQFITNGADHYEWLSHMKCNFLANYLWYYIGPIEGMTSEEFIEGCRQFKNQFVCEECTEYHNCNRHETCMDQIYAFGLRHSLKYTKFGAFWTWKCIPLDITTAYLNKQRAEGKQSYNNKG